jgi:hypothetical protein
MPDNSGRRGPGGGSIEISCRYLLDLLCYANHGSYKYKKKMNDKGKNNERKWGKKIQRNIRMNCMKEEWAKIKKNDDWMGGRRVARNRGKGKEYTLSEEK